MKNKNNGKVNKVKASSPIKCDDKPSSFIKTFCGIGLKTQSMTEEKMVTVTKKKMQIVTMGAKSSLGRIGDDGEMGMEKRDEFVTLYLSAENKLSVLVFL